MSLNKAKDCMESLRQLLSKVSTDVKRDVFCLIVKFPLTQSISQDTPLCEEKVEETIDFKSIQEKIHNQHKIIARDDLEVILDVLRDVQEELALNQFDSIQICRWGLDLLRITNTTRKVGRSVYIEINDYRGRLHQVLYKSNNNTGVYIFGIACTVAIIAAQYVFSRY